MRVLFAFLPPMCATFLVCLPWLWLLELCVDVDICSSVFTADKNCTQEQIVDKTVGVDNFDDLED